MTNVPGGAPAPQWSELDEELLDTYLAGRCTAAEWTRIDRWVGGDPQRRALLAGLRRGVTRPVDYPELPDASKTAAVLQGLTRGLHRESRVAAPRLPRVHMPRFRVWPVAAAVGVAGLVVLGVRIATPPRAPHAASEHVTYATAAGQEAMVTLVDGSRALLGPSSTAIVERDRRDGGVTVSVTGEAMFTVVHHAQMPFRVRIGSAVTRVLGTRFVVRRYDTDHAARIVVTDGRVSVQSVDRGLSETPAVLSAGTLGVVDDSGHITITPNVAPEDYTALATGRMTFRKTPLRDILVELSRASGTDIQVPDSALASVTLTWSCAVSDQPLELLLDELAGMVDAHITRTGRTVTMVPGRRSVPRPRTYLIHPALEKQYGR